MANILSQEEVDALLGALPEDVAADAELQEVSPASGSKILPYDFRRPNRVSKEQLRFIQTIHEEFVRQYASSLSGYLRSMVDIEILTVDQLSYGEYVLGLPSTTSLYIFSMRPLQGHGVLEINPGLILSMIDRLFGGTGAQSDFNRDLTNIETAVMTKLVQRALSAISATWEGTAPLTAELEDIEHNPQMMQLLSTAETVILISFELRMTHASGILSLCYPFLSMESIIPKITSRQALLGRKREAVPEGPAWIGKRIGDTPVEVMVELGRTGLTVREFLRLQRGDVVRLEQRVDRPVEVTVGGRPKAKARPGLRGQHRVAQIESLYQLGEGDRPHES